MILLTVDKSITPQVFEKVHSFFFILCGYIAISYEYFHLDLGNKDREIFMNQ